MHLRDTQTGSGALPFTPKSHSAIILKATGTYRFEDRQGVEFSVVVTGNVPLMLPISVMRHVTGGAGAGNTTSNVIYAV